MKNERTGKEVASAAAKILRRLEGAHGTIHAFFLKSTHGPEIDVRQVCTVDELRSVAGSALTQSPDKLPQTKLR